MSTRELELIASEPLSPSVRGLTFRTVDRTPLAFVAGQWVDVHLRVHGTDIKRAYSIANAPGQARADALELAVTRVDGGAMSNALHDMICGERVTIDGPHGFFTREAQHALHPAVFVGTGTGLAPLRAMLQQETLRTEGPPLVLLFGCRTEADILWRNEQQGWVERCPRLRVEVSLSRADASWQGRRGHVQNHLREVLQGLTRPQVYVCGLSRMVQDVRRVLKDELGFDRRQIQSERYD